MRGLPGRGKLARQQRIAALARTMLAAALEAVPPEGWTKSRAEDLRKFLGQQIERHIERKLVTRPQLEALP